MTLFGMGTSLKIFHFGPSYKLPFFERKNFDLKNHFDYWDKKSVNGYYEILLLLSIIF